MNTEDKDKDKQKVKENIGCLLLFIGFIIVPLGALLVSIKNINSWLLLSFSGCFLLLIGCILIGKPKNLGRGSGGGSGSCGGGCGGGCGG
mgnify:CR=1 FL=1